MFTLLKNKLPVLLIEKIRREVVVMKTASEKDFNPNQPLFVIFWSFSVEGPVGPYDIVGALYNRTEGLVGGGGG